MEFGIWVSVRGRDEGDRKCLVIRVKGVGIRGVYFIF